MTIESSLNIGGRGIVATGTVERGKAKIGTDCHLLGVVRNPIPTQILGIESFKKTLDFAEAGDNVGILLKGVLREQVMRGMCLVDPGKYRVGRTVKAEMYILKEEEGGRHKPFFSGYRPQMFCRTADSAVEVTLPTDKQMAMPGDNLNVTLKLNNPLVVEEGLRFALREGGKTVAAGVVTEILEDSKDDIKEEGSRKTTK